MKHTKGPWRLENDGHVYVLIGSSDEHLAEIELEFLNEFDTDSSGQFSRETGEANARLIAAAPDLLEALKRLRPLLWEDIKRGHGLFSNEDLAVTDKAIAKAEDVDAKG